MTITARLLEYLSKVEGYSSEYWGAVSVHIFRANLMLKLSLMETEYVERNCFTNCHIPNKSKVTLTFMCEGTKYVTHLHLEDSRCTNFSFEFTSSYGSGMHNN